MSRRRSNIEDGNIVFRSMLNTNTLKAFMPIVGTYSSHTPYVPDKFSDNGSGMIRQNAANGGMKFYNVINATDTVLSHGFGYSINFKYSSDGNIVIAIGRPWGNMPIAINFDSKTISGGSFYGGHSGWSVSFVQDLDKSQMHFIDFKFKNSGGVGNLIITLNNEKLVPNKEIIQDVNQINLVADDHWVGLWVRDFILYKHND